MAKQINNKQKDGKAEWNSFINKQQRQEWGMKHCNFNN